MNNYTFCCVIAILVCSIPARGQAIDPRGPIRAYGDRIQVTEEGVSLKAQEGLWNTPAGASREPLWNPNWITSPNPHHSHPLAIRLRKEVSLPVGAHVQKAIALVTADRFYRLWVNGVLVSRGPDDAGNDYSPPERWSRQWLANRLDLGSFLHPGVNVIAAEVFRVHRNFTLGTTGFAFKMTVEADAPSHSVLVESGSDWQVEDVTAYSQAALAEGHSATEPNPIAFRYDAPKDEPGWRDKDFSARQRESPGAWSPAKMIPSIWGPIVVSTLPLMMEAIWPIAQVSVSQGRAASQPPSPKAAQQRWPLFLNSDGNLVVEYDRVLSGYISLAVKGIPGTIITVWPRELRTDAPGRRPLQVVLGEGVTRFESPDLESFSSLHIDVSNAGGPVEFRDIRATFVSQPVVYRGSFTSSDEALNRLWKASRWQTQMCLQNRFMDSPDHQEPIGDPGDYLIEAKVSDYAFGPIALTLQFLREFAGILDHWMANHPEGSPNFHTSYSLLWLQTLIEYYDETGDAGLLRDLAPTAHLLLARFAQWIGPNGILSEAPNYLFMDWVTIGSFATHHPPAVIGQGYLTAFYYKALTDGSRIAQLTGDTKLLSEYTKQRIAVREAFNRELWDAKEGLYRDGKPFLNHNPTSHDFLPPDRDIETHSPHINALAVLYDLASPDNQPTILKTLIGMNVPADPNKNSLDRLNVQPYFMHFVFAAEAHAGVLGLYAPAQLARWSVNPQTQTFQEMWTRGDWSHGWGGTPLIQLSSHVLGVSPGSPGFSLVALAPNTLGLTFAKGTVPTPRGDVQVSWTLDSGQFTYGVTLPAGTKATLNLSGLEVARFGRVSIDGSVPKSHKGSIMLQAGAHRVIIVAH